MSDHPIRAQETRLSFQKRAINWCMECFSMDILRDRVERNHRFLEEALELVQSLGCSQSEANGLVNYVYGRQQGDVNQEVGGVMVTLAALCFAADLDMHEAGEKELQRIWPIIDQIRVKQETKPRNLVSAAGAPVAWLVPSDETGFCRIWWRDKERAEAWLEKHPTCTLVPLYTQPHSPAEHATRLDQLEAFVRQVANCDQSDNQNIRRARELCASEDRR
jgi:NTP pyrophosphatase (non-canonical NTP hydrolase)